MNKLIALCRRFLNRETISYLFFGVVTTLVNYVIYYLLRALYIPYLAANVIAWIGAVAVAYITNKLFVFESRSFALKVLGREILSFAGARIFSLLCETLFLMATVELLGANDRIMKLAAAVFVVIINYIFSKWFIFKKEAK